MNDVAGQNYFCAVYHKKWCEFGSAIWRGLQPLEYGVEQHSLDLAKGYYPMHYKADRLPL